MDRDALEAKYRIERDKRLRSDGNDQYVDISGPFAQYLVDPYVAPKQRPPFTEEVEVAFIGAGFAGLVSAARLREGGHEVMLIEKGGDVGGTWYWNRYPGAQCDTAAMIYLPLLEETGHTPSEKYTHQPEILEHCRNIATTFDLYDNALLSTEVTGLAWEEGQHRWVISTNRGDRIRARFVGLGTGPLHRPKLPGLEGIESFKGVSFHTSRWDYGYTGGSPDGAPLEKLADQRVGVIGTGATAVQCVPHLAASAQALHVFQRTPSSIDVRNNHPIDSQWYASLQPGWQDKWLRNFTTLQTGGFAEEDLVMDGWTEIAQRIRDQVMANAEGADGADKAEAFSPAALRQAYFDADDAKMEALRARVDAIVEDPATAEALKPWYRQLCKRPCFHDAYLQAFNRPNVRLVDTDGRGVDRITEVGVVANGSTFELDCIIYATGFEVGTPYTRRSGFDLSGTSGTRLSAHWADGMRSLHGMHVHGFPNAFIVGPSQGANLISNVPHNLVDAAASIAAVVGHARSVGATRVEVTAEAEAEWVALLEEGGRSFGGDPSCTPGYYNNEGRDAGRAGRLGRLGYPAGPLAYFDYSAQWRSDGRFEGLSFS